MRNCSKGSQHEEDGEPLANIQYLCFIFHVCVLLMFTLPLYSVSYASPFNFLKECQDFSSYRNLQIFTI